MTSLFALLAAFLAGIGLYGMLSYSVAQHSRDIGIRMALGAAPADIVRAACVPTLTFVFATDPFALSLAAIVPLLVSLIAATLPALRAARLNPAVSLREPA